MVEKLKISKGNASLNIRELEKLGIVKHTHLNLNEEKKRTEKLYLERLQNVKEIYRFIEKILDESIFESYKHKV